MSKPDLFPKTSVSGIAVDPRTLERVIPESRRPDGTVRKEIKIRPGFTPQEDIRRFRGTKQAQMDARALPKGHIIGWAPPPSASSPSSSSSAATSTAAKVAQAMSKSAKKNEKRKEKRKEKREEVVRDSWEDDDDDEGAQSTAAGAGVQKAKAKEGERVDGEEERRAGSREAPSRAGTPQSAKLKAKEKEKKADGADALADKLQKLDVR